MVGDFLDAAVVATDITIRFKNETELIIAWVENGVQKCFVSTLLRQLFCPMPTTLHSNPSLCFVVVVGTK